MFEINIVQDLQQINFYLTLPSGSDGRRIYSFNHSNILDFIWNQPDTRCQQMATATVFVCIEFTISKIHIYEKRTKI